MRYVLLLLAVLPGCAAPVASDTPSEPERGFVTRTLDMVRGSPKRIEQAGRKNMDRLQLALKVDPGEVKLSEVRRLNVIGTLSNPTKRTLSLKFPTSQRLEIVIEEEGGNGVVRWSEDRLFLQALGHIAINPGEYVEYKESISVRDLIAGRKYRLVFSIPNYPELTKDWSFIPR